MREAKQGSLPPIYSSINFFVNSAILHRNKDWEYAGVYADEAFTGTKDNRPEFKRLIADSKDGKIDIVITKSLSRFARNTVTTLETVRLLKEYGVDVWFERENIHSMSGDGEFMLTILASFAQEESLSASENQKWKIRKNFEDGQPTHIRLLGYYLDGDTFKIIPGEAEIVRLIYSSYLSGMGLLAICKLLTEKEYPTVCGGQWRESTIRRILTNEKYIGDMLLQKTFREDHITKKTRRNKGELPKYYIENSHEPIIDRNTFRMVREEITRRAINTAGYKQPTTKSEFTKKIVCEQCGANYRRKILAGGKVVWICGTFNRLGKAFCPSQQIPEEILKELVCNTEFSEIRIPCANTVIIVMPDGAKTVRTWQNRSRSKSWTPEMKQIARERRLSNG